jgi:hypothetical protein
MITNQMKKEEARRLKVASNNNKYLKKQTENYVMGLQSNMDFNASSSLSVDPRSTAEKLNDKSYMNRDMRNKVYKIFNNDADEADAYMSKIEALNIQPKDFNVVYPQLVQLFQGTLASADVVASNTSQLIDNFGKTGVATQSGTSDNIEATMNLIQKMINDDYKNGDISKSNGDMGIAALNRIEDIFDLDPDDASENMTEDQIKTLKKKTERQLEEMLIVMNSAKFTKKDKVDWFIDIAHDMRNISVDVQREDKAKRVSAANKIQAAAANKIQRKQDSDNKIQRKQERDDASVKGALNDMVKEVESRNKKDVQQEVKELKSKLKTFTKALKSAENDLRVAKKKPKGQRQGVGPNTAKVNKYSRSIADINDRMDSLLG